MVTVRGGKVRKIKSPAASKITASTAKIIQYQYLSRLSPDQSKAALTSDDTHLSCVMGDNCKTRLRSGFRMGRLVGDDQGRTRMHHRRYAACRIGSQAILFIVSEARRAEAAADIRSGRQADREPSEMTRIRIRSGQRKGMGAKRPFGRLNFNRRRKAFLAVDECNELAIRSRNHECGRLMGFRCRRGGVSSLWRRLP